MQMEIFIFTLFFVDVVKNAAHFFSSLTSRMSANLFLDMIADHRLRSS